MNPDDVYLRNEEYKIVKAAHDALIKLGSKYLTTYPMNFVVKTHPNVIQDKIELLISKTGGKNANN
jgi:hypothetical protein